MINEANEEMNFDGMSEDELDSFLNKAEGKEVPALDTETKEESSEDKSKTIETSDSQDDKTDETTEGSTEDKTEEDETDKDSKNDNPDVEPQYKGKSEEEVRDMHRNATRKISQQNNEIYSLKRKMDDFLDSQKRRDEEKATESKDDLLDGYVPEDVEAIEKIAERVLVKREKASIDKKKAQNETVMSEHDVMWGQLETFNPTLFGKIKEDAFAAMREDKENTYQRKGWMKQFIADKSKELEQGQSLQKEPIKKKKVPTLIRGGNRNPGQIINKSEDEMTHDEYEAHMKSKGVIF